MAHYSMTCPQCGEIPPSRKHLYPDLDRRLSTDVGCFINAYEMNVIVVRSKMAAKLIATLNVFKKDFHSIKIR